MDSNTLAHYGILGMRWGVRRTPEQLARARGKTKSEKEETPEEKKDRVLKSRSAEELYKNADLFTTDELRSAYNRLTLERDIKKLVPEHVSKGEQYANKFIKTGNKISEVADTGTKLYNHTARLYNSLTESGRSSPLPLIKDNDSKKSDKAADKAKKEVENKAKAAEQAQQKAEKQSKEAEQAKAAAEAARKKAEEDSSNSQKAQEKAERATEKAEKREREAERAKEEADRKARSFYDSIYKNAVDVDFEDVGMTYTKKLLEERV